MVPLDLLRTLLSQMRVHPKRGCVHDVTSDDASLPSLYSAWLASRTIPPERTLPPGAPRPLSRRNFQLALLILSRCSMQLCTLLWGLHPVRVLVVVFLDIFRGVLPAFRGYSQALIIDEASQSFPHPSDMLR